MPAGSRQACVGALEPGEVGAAQVAFPGTLSLLATAAPRCGLQRWANAKLNSASQGLLQCPHHPLTGRPRLCLRDHACKALHHFLLPLVTDRLVTRGKGSSFRGQGETGAKQIEHKMFAESGSTWRAHDEGRAVRQRRSKTRRSVAWAS